MLRNDLTGSLSCRRYFTHKVMSTNDRATFQYMKRQSPLLSILSKSDRNRFSESINPIAPCVLSLMS